MLAFNKKLYRTIICNISIIANENKETFIVLFNHLKIKYNFNPKKITIDFSKALILSLKVCFPSIIIIPCFFHYMQNVIRHFKEIKRKNKTIKDLAKDCLANIRMLAFIPYNKINSFYNELKNKYRVKFPALFKYIDKNYINENSIYSNIWNYNQNIDININNDIMFYTNNICESINRTLNSKFVGGCKTFYNFKNSIIDIIDLYKNNTRIYQEKNVSISRSLDYYVKKTLV